MGERFDENDKGEEDQQHAGDLNDGFRPGEGSEEHNDEQGDEGLGIQRDNDLPEDFRPSEKTSTSLENRQADGEQIRDNPDARAAFENVSKNLGRPLSDDAVESKAKFGDAKGLSNGMREGYKFGWRLEWDPDKGAHFNWFDYTEGDKGSGCGRW